MSRFADPIRGVWERHKLTAFPPGALTFHLEAWTIRGLSPAADAASARVMDLYGFDELLVVHGSAWCTDAGYTLVSGPPGIGKSTVLRNLERSGLGRLAEDGILLVGLRAGGWYLLATGTFGVLDRTSRIGSRVRSLIGVRFCLHQNADPSLLRRSNPVRSAILARLPYVSFTLATAFGPRPHRPFTPTTHEVRAVVTMPHPQDSAHALRLRRGAPAEEVADVTVLLPPGVSVLSVSPIGELGEVRARLREAILSVGDREPSGPRPG